jgi:hypothetical protein
MAEVELPPILLADADVLIDYAETDRSILRLVSEHLGPLKVLRQVLATVRALSATDCKALHIEVLNPPAEFVLLAGRDRGRLSVEDYLCFLTCRDERWTCVTNDAKLINVCREAEVAFKRGLRLMLDLVERERLARPRARQVARAIHEVNPRHINESVLRDFEDALDALSRP